MAKKSTDYRSNRGKMEHIWLDCFSKKATKFMVLNGARPRLTRAVSKKSYQDPARASSSSSYSIMAI